MTLERTKDACKTKEERSIDREKDFFSRLKRTNVNLFVAINFLFRSLVRVSEKEKVHDETICK